MNEERKYHGHVVAVNAERLGDNLDADATTAATTLVVGDVADFDELGGSVLVNGEVLRYSTCDDDAGTVTLVDPLPADAELGDPIYVWDTQRLAIAVEYIAQVEIDSDDAGDPIEAVIASHLVDDLPDGIRGLVGESVLLEEDDDEWRVVDVLGLDREAKGTLFYQDAFTVGGPGTQDFNLTYIPIPNSEHLYWNGLYQSQGSVWSRAERVVTVADADDYLAAGDVVTVEYAYRDGMAQIPAEAGGGDPLTLAVTVWYSAEYEATLYADGAELDTITDLSGNGNHATCATAGSSKPRIYHTGGPGGGPRIRFADGAYASLPSGVMTGAAAGEIMAYVKSDYTDSIAQGWWKFGTDGVQTNHYPYEDDIWDDWGRTGRRGPIIPGVTLTSWHRIGVWSATNDWEMQHNGASVNASGLNTVSWADVPRIGNSALGSPGSGAIDTFEGDFGGIILKRAKHSDTERDNLADWLDGNPSGGLP